MKHHFKSTVVRSEISNKTENILKTSLMRVIINGTNLVAFKGS